MDLPTSQGKGGQAITPCFNYWCIPFFIEAGGKHGVRGSDAWDSLTQIIQFFTVLVTVASQIGLILNLSRSTGGPFFAIICFMKPIVDTMYARDLRDKGAFCSTFKYDEGSL